MYRVPNDVRSTYHPDGTVLLDIRRGKIFGLNSVGSRILHLLDAGSDEPAIVSEISREFAIGEEIVQSDVREFVASLMRHRLVEAAADAMEVGNGPARTRSVRRTDPI